jgi:integrase
VHEARTRFRLRNGRSKDVTRRDKTGPAAERKLKKALTKLADEVAGKEINGDSPMSRVIDRWLAEFAEDVSLGKRAHKSLYDYRGSAADLIPLMGDLTCREAENAGLVNETLKEIRRRAAGNTARAKNGEAAMLRARTVLSNVCTYAVMHGAMRVNPVKSLKRIDREQEPVRALEPEERADFLAKFRAEVDRRVTAPAGGKKNVLGIRARVWTDLPELVEGMLSTGLRIGEALAVTGDDVDLDARLVQAHHHLVRVEGVGMVRQPKRKGNRPGLNVAITSWTHAMWRRRKMAAAPDGPVWPAWNGQWLDPGNVAKRISEVCTKIGYGWVTSRYFRHTTATHLGDSDLTDTAISDALGNTPDVVRKHYRRARQANPAVAAALESMMDQRVVDNS